MTNSPTLTPATELAKKSDTRYPNESDAYRNARQALLAEEIDLRRHLWRVAEQRRALPPGGEVTKDYRFEGESGPVGFADLFGDKDTLVAYSFMYGPQRKRPCPMCTSVISGWNGVAPDIEQRTAFVVIARSPIERLVAFKKERGWKNIQIYSDTTGDYTRDYVSAKDADSAAFNVFSRRDGVIRHFWSPEGGAETADPGQDPHMAPDPNPLWTLLDNTPQGRGADWYPKLEYDA